MISSSISNSLLRGLVAVQCSGGCNTVSQAVVQHSSSLAVPAVRGGSDWLARRECSQHRNRALLPHFSSQSSVLSSVLRLNDRPALFASLLQSNWGCNRNKLTSTSSTSSDRGKSRLLTKCEILWLDPTRWTSMSPSISCDWMPC